MAIFKRFYTTFLLWIVTIFFGLGIIGHIQDWLWIPIGLSIFAAKNSVSLFALVIFLLINLIILHTVSEEKYPAFCIYVSGLIEGIALSMLWGTSPSLAVVLMSAASSIKPR